MSHIQHKTHAKKVARVYVLTISDTRTEETDEGGKLARDLLRAAGHEVVGFGILRDDPALVRARVLELAAQGQVDALVSTGGTGISTRDTTYEAVAALLSKRLDGFGELFRMLSYQEIGSAAMLSRAVAGPRQHAGPVCAAGIARRGALGLGKADRAGAFSPAL